MEAAAEDLQTSKRRAIGKKSVDIHYRHCHLLLSYTHSCETEFHTSFIVTNNLPIKRRKECSLIDEHNECNY